VRCIEAGGEQTMGNRSKYEEAIMAWLSLCYATYEAGQSRANGCIKLSKVVLGLYTPRFPSSLSRLHHFRWI